MREKLLRDVCRNANHIDCDEMVEIICRYKETSPSYDELIDFYCDLYEIFSKLYCKEEYEPRLNQLKSCNYVLKNFIVSALLEKRKESA